MAGKFQRFLHDMQAMETRLCPSQLAPVEPAQLARPGICLCATTVAEPSRFSELSGLSAPVDKTRASERLHARTEHVEPTRLSAQFVLWMLVTVAQVTVHRTVDGPVLRPPAIRRRPPAIRRRPPAIRKRPVLGTTGHPHRP